LTTRSKPYIAPDYNAPRPPFRAVNFNELRVINLAAKRILNRCQIWFVTVCGQLNAMSQPSSQIVYEMICRARVMAADKAARHNCPVGFYTKAISRIPRPHSFESPPSKAADHAFDKVICRRQFQQTPGFFHRLPGLHGDHAINTPAALISRRKSASRKSR
jgi:hypothetical protein